MILARGVGIDGSYRVKTAQLGVMKPTSGDVTALLNRLADGDQEAAGQLVPLIYEELHRLAARSLRRERPGHTLQTTALLHEAYIKLATQRNAKWQNRAHFFAVASQSMRRILVDYARGRKRTKRGGQNQRVTLDEACAVSPGPSDEVLDV